MFKRLALLLTCLLFVGAARGAELFFLTDLPAKSPPLINQSWVTGTIHWNTLDLGTPPTDCYDPAAATISQCLFSITLPATVPADATRVMIRLKAVAQVPVPNVAGAAEKHIFVLAHAYNPATGENGNHIIHCETWGTYSDGTQLRRRVCYSEIWLPIYGGKIYLRVGKRVMNAGWVSVAATLEAYYK